MSKATLSRCRCVELVRGRARRRPAADPAYGHARDGRVVRRAVIFGPDERQQRLAVEAAGDRQLIA
jgi:hypothetical protein